MGKDNNYAVKNMLFRADKLYSFNSTLIMGIINVTPDSFYSESRGLNKSNLFEQVEDMVEAGAQILDVGGVSTRPGAVLLTTDEELKRVVPIIKEIRSAFPEILISIDTFRSKVAKAAVEAGANIVNDVYGGRYDDEMFDTVASLNVPYVLMHSRGDASNMQDLTTYDNLVEDVILELSKSIRELRRRNVKDIIIDPGFGFAKNMHQNYELMKHISCFNVLDCPLLIGVSRKSMIYKLFNSTPERALNGTSVLNTWAVGNNAAILRVHDPKEAREVVEIMQKIKQ